MRLYSAHIYFETQYFLTLKGAVEATQDYANATAREIYVYKNTTKPGLRGRVLAAALLNDEAFDKTLIARNVKPER